MAEWFNDVKLSKKAYVPDPEPLQEVQPSYGNVEEGDLQPAEISELSRPGYSRGDTGGYFASMQNKGVGIAKGELPKPNNVSMRLPRPEQTTEVAWPVNQPRIVDHHGQGGNTTKEMQDRSAIGPLKPGYSRNPLGGFFTS